MRRVVLVMAAALAAAMVLAGTPAHAVGAATPATPATTATTAVAPGAAGIGDPYYADYGNGGYDVTHYDIRLRYWPGTDKLAGTTTILARARADLSRLNLDFALTVSEVRVNGWPARFAREGDHELVVTPARPVTSGQNLTIVVRYSGTPSQVAVAGLTPWVRTPDGAVAAGEPEIAWWWYPSNDHPLDKATFDVSVLVPDGVEALSNGVMSGQTRAELPGWSRWSWRHDKPMATYLAFLVIGQYDVRTDTAPNGQPVINAYSTRLGEFAEHAVASVERTAEVVQWEQGLFGTYPFEAQGGVVVPPSTLGFALENQTRSVYAAEFFRRGSNTYVVVHENAHQWFGDSVSVHHWEDIWLNEGFASYAEWLWSESVGEGTAQELFDFNYARNPADSSFWQVVVGDPGVSNMFDSAVYQRGAMTLHQLRLTTGDQAFFQILREWTTSRRYGNGTTPDFRSLAERISGKDLDHLFTTWLFTPTRPDLGAVTTSKAVPVPPSSWAKISAAHDLLDQRRATTTPAP